jgi:tRNA nucleotidyltransferase (CCA-adding enzyme)
MKSYLVGGAVRDALLGLRDSDRDWVVVGATPEQMHADGYIPVGRDFPVFLHPDSKEEYALARTERKSGVGYKGFVVYAAPSVTLEEDLQRRDLTINAMAQDSDGTLIDPWGGAADLQARILRHVSPAFAEDPLRVLRVARFAARFASAGFSIATDTMALMSRMSQDGELGHLTAERIWREFDLALQGPDPRRFIEVLRECGALAVLLPEVNQLFGVPQAAEWHPEVDTGLHVLMCLDQAVQLSDDAAVRFAVLMHDVGKGLTPEDNWPHHYGHEKLGARSIEAACQRLRVPTGYAELARLTSLYHTHCHRAAELKPLTLLRTLDALDAFRRPQRLAQFLLACEADARGRTGFENRPYPQAGIFRRAWQHASAISVPELLKSNPVPSGAQSGEIIRKRLHEARLRAIREGATTTTRDPQA